MRTRYIVAIVLLMLAGLAVPAISTFSKSGKPANNSADHKLSAAFTSVPKNDKRLLGLTPVIVLTYGTPSFLLKSLVTQLGGTITREFTYITGFAAILPVDSLGILALNLGVASITPDRLMAPLLDVNAATAGADVAAQNFGVTGKGVGVAVIDSGVNGDHEDFLDPATGRSRVVYSQNFVPGESSTRDLYGHGTHVAGIIAGNGTASSGAGSIRTIRGVAPGAKIVNLRVLNSQGGGRESDVIAGIEKAIALQSTYNIRIINLSLGAGVFDSYVKDPLCKSVQVAWNRGITVIVSAGNYGNTEYGPYGLITSPGNSPYVVTVGATNAHATVDAADDTITTYSSRGPSLFDHVVKPDLVAPGNRVKSLLAYGSTLSRDPLFTANQVNPAYYYSDPSGKAPKYFSLSGTSMATPMVAGAAALMFEKEPSLNNNSVKLRLMASANKIFSQRYDLFTVGAGMLNIPAALQQTGVTYNSKSPYVKRDPNNPNLLLVIDGGWNSKEEFASGVVWGGNIFGNGVVWGGNVVWSNGVVWGGSSPFSDPTATNANSQRGIAANGDE